MNNEFYSFIGKGGGKLATQNRPKRSSGVPQKECKFHWVAYPYNEQCPECEKEVNTNE